MHSYVKLAWHRVITHMHTKSLVKHSIIYSSNSTGFTPNRQDFGRWILRVELSRGWVYMNVYRHGFDNGVVPTSERARVYNVCGWTGQESGHLVQLETFRFRSRTKAIWSANADKSWGK